MAAISTTQKSAINVVRTALGIGGIVAVVLGILILVAPIKTAAVIAAIIAVYAIVSGLIYGGIGIFSKQLGTWSRIGHLVLGVLFVVAGVFAFTDLGNVTAFLAIFVTVFIGASWIVEGVVALTTLGRAASKGWVVLSAIVSVLAGVFIILSPLWAAALLWLFLGISLIVLGIIQIVRAFSYENGTFRLRADGGAEHDTAVTAD